MNPWLCALFATLTTVAIQSSANSETVTLLASDSEMQIQGHLLSADTTHFLIKTSYGQVRIERAVVVCEGTACPAADELLPKAGTSLDGEVLSSGS